MNPETLTAQTALDEGIALAADADPEAAKRKAREQADVKRWMGRIEQTGKFDEAARKQYAKDRRYARGDSGFEVDANIIGNNIDILESFLYARDPDFDVTPGPSVETPTDDALRRAAEQMIGPPPAEVMLAAEAAGPAGTPLLQQTQQVAIDQQVQAIKAKYAERKREIKNYCETVEIVGTRLWYDAALKRRGRPFVRSALTTGLGVLKASWQERTAQSPETSQAINDLQANIARIKKLQAELDEPSQDHDATLTELERQLVAVQNQVERVVARGFVVDNVAPEDFRVAPGYTIANHLDAPWNAHRIFIAFDDALAEFGDHLSQYGEAKEVLAKATIYYPRKPETVRQESALAVQQPIEATDADAYIAQATPGGEADCEGKGYLALWEIWDRDSNAVLTAIEGVSCYVKPDWTPPATTRFYPFFVMCLNEVDGQRHPQSLVTRSMKLVDEYNRIGSAEAEHRRRSLPGVLFDAGAVEPEGVKKLTASLIAEFTGVKRTGQRGWADIFYPKPYAPVDAALYDRQRIVQEIERIWGVQEALSGAVNVAKTATEADIQQQGFQARTSSRRDLLESVLSDLALYTIEIARVYMSAEDVVAIAGPAAFWPPYGGPEDVTRMVNVQVRAGSSGKPNTAAERESWSTVLPMLQEGVQAIGTLRGSSPLEIADALEKLLRETAARSGDRIDIDSLVPSVGPMGGMVPAGPGAPGEPPAAPAEQPPAPMGA